MILALNHRFNCGFGGNDLRVIDADLFASNIKAWAENIRDFRSDNKCFFTEENVLNAIDDQPTIENVQNAISRQTPKKPIRKEMPYSEGAGFNDEWYCPVCNSYIGYFTEGMSEPEQMEYCNECGQHIARDWSEDDD